MHGGRYHSIVNFFRRGKVKFDGKVHHLVKVTGETGEFPHPIEHYPFSTVSEFIKKHNRYTDYEAAEMFEKFKDTKLKELRYNLGIKPLKMFFKAYVKKKGYKDGTVGLIFCVLFSWSYFLRWAKYWELCRTEKPI